jgi:hypothetical protein
MSMTHLHISIKAINNKYILLTFRSNNSNIIFVVLNKVAKRLLKYSICCESKLVVQLHKLFFEGKWWC